MSEQEQAVYEAIDSTWPREAAIILSALDTSGWQTVDRRQATRSTYRVKASLRLFIDDACQPRRVLYTRDVCRRSLGFITQHHLPLGYGGTIDIADPRGQMVTVNCTLLRCREAAPGWYEGSLYFNREQPVFDTLGM